MSRIPPLPEPDIIGPSGALRAYSADQLRARDRQIVEACAQVAESTTKFGAYANGNTIPDEIARAIRSLLGEGEGDTNGG